MKKKKNCLCSAAAWCWAYFHRINNYITEPFIFSSCCVTRQFFDNIMFFHTWILNGTLNKHSRTQSTHAPLFLIFVFHTYYSNLHKTKQQPKNPKKKFGGILDWKELANCASNSKLKIKLLNEHSRYVYIVHTKYKTFSLYLNNARDSEPNHYSYRYVMVKSSI